MRRSLHREKGNALFLILIAVALFAALSYAVTRSGRGGGGIERENMLIAAAEIDAAISAYRATITRMVLNGLPPEQIDYAHPGAIPAFTNPACTSDDCRVFHATGGGLSLYTLKGGANLDAADTTGAIMRFGVGATGSGITAYGTGLLDITAYIRVSEALCLYFNKQRGWTAAPGANTYDPPEHVEGVAFTTNHAFNAYFSTPFDLGEHEGCQLNNNVSGYYGAGHYIHAVIYVR